MGQGKGLEEVKTEIQRGYSGQSQAKETGLRTTKGKKGANRQDEVRTNHRGREPRGGKVGKGVEKPTITGSGCNRTEFL